MNKFLFNKKKINILSSLLLSSAALTSPQAANWLNQYGNSSQQAPHQQSSNNQNWLNQFGQQAQQQQAQQQAQQRAAMEAQQRAAQEAQQRAQAAAEAARQEALKQQQDSAANQQRATAAQLAAEALKRQQQAAARQQENSNNFFAEQERRNEEARRNIERQEREARERAAAEQAARQSAPSQPNFVGSEVPPPPPPPSFGNFNKPKSAEQSPNMSRSSSSPSSRDELNDDIRGYPKENLRSTPQRNTPPRSDDFAEHLKKSFSKMNLNPDRNNPNSENDDEWDDNSAPNISNPKGFDDYPSVSGMKEDMNAPQTSPRGAPGYGPNISSNSNSYEPRGGFNDYPSVSGMKEDFGPTSSPSTSPNISSPSNSSAAGNPNALYLVKTIEDLLNNNSTMDAVKIRILEIFTQNNLSQSDKDQMLRLSLTKMHSKSKEIYTFLSNLKSAMLFAKGNFPVWKIEFEKKHDDGTLVYPNEIAEYKKYWNKMIVNIESLGLDLENGDARYLAQTITIPILSGGDQNFVRELLRAQDIIKTSENS